MISASIESTSTDFIRDIKSKYRDSCDINDKVNMLFNESTIETNVFKRPFIEKEEIKPKKRREYHSRLFKGDIFFLLNTIRILSTIFRFDMNNSSCLT